VIIAAISGEFRMDTSFAICVVLSLPTIVLVTGLWMRSRERMRILDIVQKLAEADKPLSVEVLQVLPGGAKPSAPQRDLRRGVMLVAIGAAFGVLGLCGFAGLPAFAPGSGNIGAGVGIAAIGALPFCIGCAFIYLSRADR
jgi:hypothetical protein